MFSARVALGFLLVSDAAIAQQYLISTVAGGGVPNNAPGTSISFSPQKVAVDKAGNVFVLDLYAVYRLPASGVATIVVGNGTPGYSGDGGLATSAQINSPVGIALDPQGSLFISDTNNNCVRRVDAKTGIITTFAGTAVRGYSGDGGPATQARLSGPTGIAVDADGTVYISDIVNFRVRRVDPSSGNIDTYVGTGTAGYSGDGGQAAAAAIYNTWSLSLDASGNLYLADAGGGVIRKVTKVSGLINTVAGTRNIDPNSVSSGDGGPATAAQLGAADLTFDTAGNLYIADWGFGRIRRIDGATGIITSVAGTSNSSYGGDGGAATKAGLYYPKGIAVDAAGNLYIADVGNYRVRKVSALTGNISTIVGTGDASFSGDNGTPTKAQLSSPTFLALDTGGNLYISDTSNRRIRKVSATSGTINTVAGGGTVFGTDGGQATASQIDPSGITVDAAGNIFFAESGHIRKVTASSGIITTVVAIPNYLGGGGLVLDSSGSFYVCDLNHSQVLKVSGATGAITVFAGSGVNGFSGDGGPAVNASFSLYTGTLSGGLGMDQNGNLYIVDAGNSRVRRVDALTGVVTTVAGNGSNTYVIGSSLGDGGRAVDAQLLYPTGLAIDRTGKIYIGAQRYRIRQVNTAGIITTIAGNGGGCFGGETGIATSVVLGYLFGLAVDPSGNVFVADTQNNRVRKLVPLPLGVSAVVNGASNIAGAISPGEIVVLYGSELGPAQITEAHVGDDGRFGTVLAGTSVSFNGIAAPVIYTSATQVSAVVPYGVPGGAAQITVTYQGQTTATFSASVAASAPGIFSSDGTGKGQAAAVNQDNSLNTAGTPAKIGDVVVLFATGEGQTNPGGVDGKPATVPIPQPNLPVAVVIGGQTVKPQYAGGAPGEVAGVMQINVQIPSGIQIGNAVPVVVQVGSVSSQPGVTIAVR